MRILIIDDDIFFRKFYQSKLEEKGIVVDVAKDGEEGLAKASKDKPNVILLDLIMPQIDGFDVLSTLSKNEQLRQIPVIVLSSLGQEQDIEKAKKLGAADYINKSVFDFDTLMNKIAALSKERD